MGRRALPLSQHMLNSSEGSHAWLLHVGDAAGKVAFRCAKCEGSLADKGALCSERIMDSGVGEDWTACCCRKPPSTPFSFRHEIGSISQILAQHSQAYIVTQPFLRNALSTTAG